METSVKKIITLSIIAVLLLLIALSFRLVKPGYVGVVVDLFGSKQGVETREKHVGVHFVPLWKQIYMFPIFQQNDTWENEENFQFQTSEGLAMRADIGISFHLRPNEVPNIFQRYRRGIDEISHVFIRNFIRDAINISASKLEIEDLYGTGKEKFFVDIEAHVQNDMKKMGIEVDRIYLIGRFYFPDNVIAALNCKIEATQRAQQRENELREAEAQAKKDIAKSNGEARCILINAKAQADANDIISKSLSPLLIQWENISKWNGVLPKVTGSSSSILNIKEI